MKVLFEPEGKKVEASAYLTLLEIARSGGVGLRSECGGVQSCGKCQVIVRDQRGLSEVNDRERLLLSNEKIAGGYRLACVARILPGFDQATVTVPTESVVRERKFVEVGVDRFVKLDPVVKKFLVEVAEPSPSDRRSDIDKLLGQLSEGYRLTKVEVDYHVMKSISDLPYSSRKMTAVVFEESRVIGLEEGDSRDNLYGLAIDVGTSRITCTLVNLSKGETLFRRSVENPQIAYGEDVMSRMSYAQESQGNKLHLQREVVEGINRIIDSICKETRLDPGKIYAAVVVGNTVMHHLLLGIETRHLARSPFTPVIRDTISVSARDLGIEINHNGVITSLPIVDAFVGSDAVGDLLSSGMYRRGKPTLLLDIGTNTEVMLRSMSGIICCSCASGPAFEGVHIEHGMKAVAGAIESVRIGKEGLDVNYSIIGDCKPVGLCGSAIIDVTAQMLKSGIINRVGKFSPGLTSSRLRKTNNVSKFVIAWGEETGTGREITISERDITEVILAKAAIYSACAVLMKVKKVDCRDLSRVLIAGAFGSHLDKMNAKMIGLIPDVENKKIMFIGNAAIAGAEIALKSQRMRKCAEKISRDVEYLELAASDNFVKEYMNALLLHNRSL